MKNHGLLGSRRGGKDGETLGKTGGNPAASAWSGWGRSTGPGHSQALERIKQAAGSDFGSTCKSKLNGRGFSQNPAFLRADHPSQLWLGFLGWRGDSSRGRAPTWLQGRWEIKVMELPGLCRKRRMGETCSNLGADAGGMAWKYMGAMEMMGCLSQG